jgi:hypothetical protein
MNEFPTFFLVLAVPTDRYREGVSRKYLKGNKKGKVRGMPERYRFIS